MATVPVICDNRTCGTLWGSTNLIAGDAGSITLKGNKVGPCPRCGGLGSVPDGEFDLIDDALEVVQSADVPADVLQGLIRVLEARAVGDASDAEVIERVESEAPALASVVREYLAKSDPASWLTLLVTVLVSLMQPSPPSAQDIAKEIWANEPPAAIQPQRPSRHRVSKARTKRLPKKVGTAKRSKSRKRR